MCVCVCERERETETETESNLTEVWILFLEETVFC